MLLTELNDKNNHKRLNVESEINKRLNVEYETNECESGE